jgi:hypothetical protein
MNLQTASTPALQQLHTLRDQHGADLVSLLVWNGGGAGETTCGVDSGRACGRAVTTRRLAQPGDIPHSVIWNYEYRFNGFSVAHMPSAFRAFTFVHEVSHNLGAHHDAYSFNQDGYDPTADPFARGWVLFEANARTVMAYRRICEDLNLFPGTPRSGICRTIPRFSSADQTYYSHPLGAATQGSAFQPIFGPADNVLAINRMAWTAANFRRSLP